MPGDVLARRLLLLSAEHTVWGSGASRVLRPAEHKSWLPTSVVIQLETIWRFERENLQKERRHRSPGCWKCHVKDAAFCWGWAEVRALCCRGGCAAGVTPLVTAG